MKQTLKQEISDAFAKIHVIADTFEHPEKYAPMSESDYIIHVKEEAKKLTSNGQED